MTSNSFNFARAGRAGITIAAASLALGLAACGDDDEESTSAESEATTEASAEEVTVTATEYEFDLSATPATDTKKVTFTNDGKEFHVLIFAKINEGFTVDEAIKLEGEKGSAEMIGQAEAAPGQTATVEVKKPLEPGDYAMLCPLQTKGKPHSELGQLEEFAIE